MERGHFDTKRFERLNNPGRLKELRPKELLSFAGLKQGMKCVDLGAGTGVFAFPMADIVGPGGLVTAVDNSSDVLDYIQTHGPPAQMRFVRSDVSDTGLEPGSADFCLAAFVMHELAKPDNLVAEARRILRTGARFAIVEWRMDSIIGPPQDVKISVERARELLLKAGFSVESVKEWSVNHYVILGKKEAPPEEI